MGNYDYIPFRSASYVTCRSRKRLLKGAKATRSKSAVDVVKNDLKIANKKAIAKSNQAIEFDKPKTAFAGVLRSNLIRMAMN